MLKLLLLLNDLFRRREHPFNQKGDHKLNYADFEYQSAKKVFKDFEKVTKIKIKDIVKDKMILDLACGAGGKSLYIQENGAKFVYGVDMNQILINQANDFVKDNPKIKFIVGDVTNIPFDDNSFDMLIANDLMEHVSDPEKMLEESYRVLTKGGKLFINFEPYYHFLGHHMWDVINIPWAHVIFSEKTRIKAYKILVKYFEDAKERISFRINKDDQGREYIGYLNHMTLRRYKRIVAKSKFVVQKKKILRIKKLMFFPFRFIPFINELFIERCVYILVKE